jgi:membrane fusion protein (multidrug efflux system)
MAQLTAAGWVSRVPAVIWRLGALLAAGLIVWLFATRWTRWEGARLHQTTDDAYLTSDITPISAKVPGYLRLVPVQDYAHVRAGQMIAQIVDDDYRASVAQAEAAVALAKAQESTLTSQIVLQTANIHAARAQLEATRASLDQARRDLKRAQKLLASGSGSTESRERSSTSLAQLVAEESQRDALLQAAERQQAVLAAQLQQARATVQERLASLDQAHINLGYTVIRAPTEGVIGQRQAFPGQYLAVGGQVTTLAALPRVWIIANYRETQLTHVRVGQEATFTVDSYPGHTLRGHVNSFSPASGAQLALLPPDNATGNFTKIVQRFAVKIVIDDPDGLAGRLLPGMSVIATIKATRAPEEK